MADNVLQSIGLTPEWFKSVMGGVINDPSAPAPDTATPAPQVNALQAVNTGAPPVDAPLPAPTNLLEGIPGYGASAAPDPANQVPQGASPRRSLLDTVGQISDVLAKVGGAQALYQPTIDARQDRQLTLGDHARAVDLEKLKLASNQMDNTTQAGKIAGQAVRGVKAILAANPGADPTKVWQAMAAQTGVDPAHTAAIAQAIAQDPNSLSGLDAALNGAGKTDATKYGGTAIYATGPDGKLAVFQPGLGDQAGRSILPEGYTPVDPTKVVNLGGETALIGDKTGTTKQILQNTIRPDTVANNQTQRDIAKGRNDTQITIAGMPAREKSGGGAAKGDPYSAFTSSVSGLRSLDNSLNDLVSDPNIHGATGLIGGHLNLTSGQRAIQAKIESLSGQAIPAAIAAIKASGGASPRAVSEITGEAKGLVGAIQNRNQDPNDYISNVNAARARLRQRILEMTDDAVRQGFAVRDKSGNISPAPAANRSLPPRLPGSPLAAGSGWGKATIVGQ